MAMPRISTVVHELATRRVTRRAGDDAPVMLEALGLVAYQGFDTTNRSGTGRGKKTPAIREPELFIEEEERERLKFLGSTNAPQRIFEGFNRYESVRSGR